MTYVIKSFKEVYNNIPAIPLLKRSVGTTELYHSTKKRQDSFDILKSFFIRHSSEYKTSDSDQKVNRNIFPDADTRDRMHQEIGDYVKSSPYCKLCTLLILELARTFKLLRNWKARPMN